MIPTSESELTALLQKLPFWEHLTAEEASWLPGQASLNRYPAGAILHSAQLECIGLLQICTGSLRVFLLSEEGREITLYRLGPGELCVLSASCVLHSITFDVHIDAVEDCTVLQTGASALSRLMQENIHVEVFAYRLIAEHFSDVMWTMQQILFMSFDRRLAIFLLDESASLKSDEIHMTHEEIARLMGSAREVVTRMLKYFSSEGYVELSRGMVKLTNKAALRRLC